MPNEEYKITTVNYIATIGFFDGVHLGHRFLIDRVRERAAAQGLGSMVVTFDRHPREVLQADYVPTPLTTPEEKLRLLRDTGVDRVEVLRFTREMAAVPARDFMRTVLRERLGVSALIIGYDNRFGRRQEGEGFADYVAYGREMGMEVIRAAGYTLADGTRVSSSLVRRLIASGDVAGAARCLGRRYQIRGTVRDGEHEGRRMGFPTANLEAGEQRQLLPANGVYATTVSIDSEKTLHTAMTCIGRRPTFGGDHTTIETHLLHFSGNLYGHEIRLSFDRRIRDERRFESEQALARQLAEDRERVLSEE